MTSRQVLYSVFAISAVLFLLVFILMLVKPQLFHWTYFLTVVFFASMTYFMMKILLKKADDPMFVSTFSMLSGVKLLFSLLFIFIVIILLPKKFMLGFIISSALSYIGFTVYEISTLLAVLKQNKN